jgi:hypothetical protein
LLQTRHITNPYILWNNLKNLYEAKGFSSEFILSRELINLTLTSCKGNLENYLNSFRRIVNSLESRSINLPTKFVVALLLNNLNKKDYEYIVAVITQTIRTNNSEIDLEEIISQLLDESRRLGTTTSYYNRYISVNTNNNSYNKSSSYNNDVEMSLQTNNKKYTKNKFKNNLKCNFCKLKEHLESNCYSKNPSLKRDNSVNNSSAKEETILISSNKTINNNTIDFILDSGATIHTCYIKELFTSLKPTSTSIK